jgi:hypothetical protein
MAMKDRIRRPRDTVRARQAESSVGPVGNLFASPAVARVLVAFLQDPGARLTLGQVRERSDKRAKGTVQAGLRTLMAAHLVYREGRGNRTVYRYASDRELGRRMLDLIAASRREVAPAGNSDIPWLEGLMRSAPGTGIDRPYGEREEEFPSVEVTESVLAAGGPVEAAQEARTRPGLRTRV